METWKICIPIKFAKIRAHIKDSQASYQSIYLLENIQEMHLLYHKSFNHKLIVQVKQKIHVIYQKWQRRYSNKVKFQKNKQNQ